MLAWQQELTPPKPVLKTVVVLFYTSTYRINPPVTTYVLLPTLFESGVKSWARLVVNFVPDNEDSNWYSKCGVGSVT